MNRKRVKTLSRVGGLSLLAAIVLIFNQYHSSQDTETIKQAENSATVEVH